MSNLKLTEEFCAAWSSLELNAIMERLAPDAFYHNIPMEPKTGHAAIRANLEPFFANASMIKFEIHQIAETASGAVLTERTDYFTTGPKTISIRVMGIFEFKDGLISSWRDYFDLAQFTSQMG